MIREQHFRSWAFLDLISIDDSFILTLSYALSELRKDVEDELLKHPESARAALREATKFAVFVVHNKSTVPKKAEIPAGVLSVQPPPNQKNVILLS